MSGAALRLGGGARAVEELLLEDLDALVPDGPEALRHGPVRLVVPSRALRLHLQARLVARHGAVLGVSAQTLRGLAIGVLDAAGERPAPGSALLVPLCRQAAREEPALAPVLRLEGGPRAVAGGVRDLLDAGLDEAAAEAALEVLAQQGDGRGRERAAALVRCAVSVLGELERHGLAAPAAVLRRAAELLAPDFDRLLPARAVLVHGFADATGAATELIQALLRHDGARLYLDRPPDPARPEEDDSGGAFVARFAERALPGATGRRPERRAEPAALELLRAPGARAEGAAVARAVRGWLDAGTAPERIGVLVRRPAQQLDALRAELRRAGVPFSCGQAAGPPGAGARRVEALRRLLRGGERAGLESWLDARSGLSGDQLCDRLSALRVLGAPRLRDVAALGERLPALADEHGRVALALRRGLATVGGGGEGAEDEDLRAVAPHRKVPVEMLEREADRARRTLAALEARPARSEGRRQLELLSELLTGPLGWSFAREKDRPLLVEFARVAGELPAGLELEREDADGLLQDALSAGGRHPAGGAGGGVQLLGVMEARGLTFERLVLAGLNRDSFPRVVREDPLLPDSLRRALNGGGAGVLPDLAEKGAGVDEERFLFAQALSAAPQALLTWQSSDEEGKARPASPLVERLRLERARGSGAAPEEAPLAPHRHAPPPEGAAEERPALDHAVLAGLHGPRAGLKALLPAALAEAGRELGGLAGAAAAAAARAQLLDELDPDPHSAARRRLGPWFGFVGPIVEEADPRREPLAVTRLEDVARCGWRSFVARVLRVEPAPDPLGALPALSRLLLGQVVHDVLEQAVEDALGGDRPSTLPEALAAGPVRVVLPPASELRQAFRASVERRAAEAGLPLGAFAEVVAGRAAELYETARSLDGAGAPLEVIGAELEGAAAVALPGGGTREVRFKADRVDLADGAPLLVDYKTGKPPGTQAKPETRRAAHLAAVRKGSYLQPSAYAAAGGPGSAGRLLFLGEGLEERARVFEVAAGEEDFAAAFAAVVGVVDAAWTGGAFLPRLDDGKGVEPDTCRWCEVREACLRGDSGARMRLREWAASQEEAGRRPEGPAGAALDLFALADRAEAASS